MEEGKRNRISGIAAFFAVAVALATDGLQFLLDLFVVGAFVNWAIDVCFALGLGMWLAMSGVSFWDNPRIGLGILATFTGEILGVGAMPFWSLDVFYIVSVVRAEDGNAGILGKTAAVAGGLATGKLPTKGVQPPPFPKQPPPLPKQPPPLPKQLPNTAAVPVPSAPLVPQPQLPMAGQEITPVGSTRGAVNERARALEQHAAEYRRGIEERTRRYGAKARKGQEFVQPKRIDIP